jgi:hypothetical protein
VKTTIIFQKSIMPEVPYRLTAPVDDIQISKGYFGNPNLKRVGEAIEWTPERLRSI